MRIVFCGHGDFGFAALKALLEAGKEIVHVYTHPSTFDANSGHKFPDLKALAEEYGISCSMRENKDTARMAPEILAMEADLLISVTWRALFPESVINMPKRGSINVHGSLLPKYRGNAPIAWAMINGDKECGLTAHKIDRGMDTGDIVVQKAIPILYEDTIATLMSRMIEFVGPLVLEAVRRIGNPSFKPIKQNNGEATIAKKRRPEDGVIDWSWQTARLYNWVRALTRPLPGAFTLLPMGKLIIWKAKPEIQKGDVVACGTIVCADETSISVQAEGGLIRIEEATLINSDNASIGLQAALKKQLIKVGDVFCAEQQETVDDVASAQNQN